MNEKKVSREKLEILLKQKNYEQAIDLTLETKMNSGFMRTLQEWISHVSD